MTKGFKGGQVRIMSGFTSVGKTTWTMNEMLLYAKQRIPVGIFCFESDQVDVILNMVQYLADKPIGQLSRQEVYSYMDELDNMPIHFFDERNFTDAFNIIKFKDLVKQIRDRFGIKFLVLDNMQFLLNFDHERINFDEKVTRLMTELKNMSKILDIHLIGMVHLNRAAYGAKDKNGNRIVPKPQVHDLKGSSGFEQTADYVMFVHRDTGFDAPDDVKNDVEIIVAKNRPGKGVTGVINFKYIPEKCAYKEC
jgi:replicative DNA helicase